MTTQIRVSRNDAPDPGSRTLRFVDGRSVVLFNIEGVIHAIDNSCPHNGASLANGRLDGTILQCPAHGLRFDLVSGCVVGAPGLCLTKLAVEPIDGEPEHPARQIRALPTSPTADAEETAECAGRK